MILEKGSAGSSCRDSYYSLSAVNPDPVSDLLSQLQVFERIWLHTRDGRRCAVAQTLELEKKSDQIVIPEQDNTYQAF
jgi:hypothetical protein